MTALSIDEIKSYASKWGPNDDEDVNIITRAFNEFGIHESFREVIRIERGEVALPEPMDEIYSEQRRKDILAEVTGPIERLGHFPIRIKNAATSERIVSSTWKELFESVLIGAGAPPLLMALIDQLFGSRLYPSLIGMVLWGVIGLFLYVICTGFYGASRRLLANKIADHLSATASERLPLLQRIKSELEDSHNIDLIRARDIANVHRASAVATAIDVGNVTKTVAAETAEITKNLIQEGQKLKAEHAASQVELIDQLAGNLERPAPQASPAAPAPVDDRDARIAALKAELAKEEEIRTLEARLAQLKGG